ncbi:hypothetical protein [Hymenobacter crusticola]|uniref:Uncharacterized protein n=1 Tax=Hymenobacter crusticola TaxID=1770526 RepID=A0A243W5E4_9BACT|nr:hypothetical protein [Hymenobacter crusticola]OUJ68658.1 hypothetical protein BXP70_27610 [Hymenobacter crusticola]
MADNKPTSTEQQASAPKELTLEQQLEQLKQQLAAKEQESADKDAIIEGQTEQLKAAEAQGAGALPVIIHEKKRYQVLARKFIIRNIEVDAEKLKTDKDLVKELVENGSGLLKALD